MSRIDPGSEKNNLALSNRQHYRGKDAVHDLPSLHLGILAERWPCD